jgi:hypothetical protein
VFANPHGLQLGADVYSTYDAFISVASLNAGVLSLAETNINGDHPLAKPNLYQVTKKVWKHSAVAFSHTNKGFNDLYQPGGTMTMACRNWTSRVIEKGVDRTTSKLQ